jgi:hypothetical protein
MEEGAILRCHNEGNIALSGNVRGMSVGGITGGTSKSEIVDSFNSGTISLTRTKYRAEAGGIAGVIGDVFIRRCANSGKINILTNGHSTISGGLVGRMLGNLIEESFNCGSIQIGTDFVAPDDSIGKFGGNQKLFAEVTGGGIVGYFYGVSIINTYNTGIVRGKLSIEGSSAIIFLGGIAGIEVPFLKKTKTIQNSFNTGHCEIESWNGGETLHGTGGIVGMSVEDVSGRNKIENSYWMENKGSTEGIARSNGKDESVMFSADDFKNPENFKDWDFEKIWMMPPENPVHPVLRNLPLE